MIVKTAGTQRKQRIRQKELEMKKIVMKQKPIQSVRAI